MLHKLSKFIPVRFSSAYVVVANEPRRETATWWQWRNRIFLHRVTTS